MTSTPDDELNKCHDASGTVQRNPKYLAPLRTVPNAELSSKALGSIYVTGKAAAEKVRIFVKESSEWTYVHPNSTFTAEELGEGLELGIDARDVRRPDWDGQARVHFSIEDGDETASDSVVLRVAPILTHHHAQPAEKTFVSDGALSDVQRKFISDFEAQVAAVGIDEPVFRFPTSDIWTQDFFEPGYTSIPGPDGPVVLRVMIRSSQMERAPGRLVFQLLRSNSVGAVQYPAEGGILTLDSTGNLETIPPYTHNGKSYPAGRIIQGSWDGERPLIWDFLAAQEVQEPLELDTTWLDVGHVDEFVQFLPVDSERGWVMMVDDPLAGLELLQEASKNGHGSERALSRPRFPWDGSDQCLPTTTIDEELDQANFTSINEAAARRIQGNIDIIKTETGITDDEIFRVPALFYFFEDSFTCNDNNSTSSSVSGKASGKVHKEPPNIVEAAGKASKLGRRQISETDKVVAHYPGTINGVVLSDSFYLAPNPWGPVIDGKDIIAEAVTAVYSKANYNVTYMDDWYSHHIGGGEVHCGSNTWRSTDAPWW